MDKLKIEICKYVILTLKELYEYIQIRKRVDMQNMLVWEQRDILTYQTNFSESSLEKLSTTKIKGFKPNGRAKFYKPEDVINFLLSNKDKINSPAKGNRLAKQHRQNKRTAR